MKIMSERKTMEGGFVKRSSTIVKAERARKDDETSRKYYMCITCAHFLAKTMID